MDEEYGIGEVEHVGCDERRVFAKAVSARDLGLDSMLLEDLVCDHADGEDRRLRVRRQAQIPFRAIEAHLHDRVAERLVRLTKQFLRHIILLVEILAHADLLGALPREYECELVHRTDLSFL